MSAVEGKKQSFDRLTDEALAELRAEIGTEIKGPHGYITEATRDGIRHFAMGIGDENREAAVHNAHERMGGSKINSCNHDFGREISLGFRNSAADRWGS